MIIKEKCPNNCTNGQIILFTSVEKCHICGGKGYIEKIIMEDRQNNMDDDAGYADYWTASE